MIYTLDGELHLQDVPTPLLHKLIRELTVPNPRYENALRLGRPAWNIPRTIMLYEIKGNALTLPRGMAEEVWRQRPAGTTARDKTLKGEPLTFDTSRFTLRGYQQKAVNAALSCQWHQGGADRPLWRGKDRDRHGGHRSSGQTRALDHPHAGSGAAGQGAGAAASGAG